MTSRSILLPGLLLSASLFGNSAGARSQSPPAAGSAVAGSHRAASAVAPPSELASRQTAQSRALAAGDTVAIATTSRALAASLLQDLASLERQRGEAANAADLDVKAALLAPDGGSASGGTPSTTKAPRPLSPTQRKAVASREEPLRKLLAECLNDLGTAEARQGDFAAAKVHFEEATHWAPPSDTLLRNLGTAAFRVGDFPTAVSSLGQYLKAAPPSAGVAPDPRSQLLYALSLFSTGNFALAAAAFAPVGADAMHDPRSAYSWAFSLSHSGDPTRANGIAAELSAQPLPPDVLSLVCHIFVDTESFGESVACYRKVLAANPSFPLAHYQIGESLIRTDRPAEAIPELRQELSLSPDDPNVQYSLAFALLQTSKKDEAFALLRTVTAAHPEMAQPQYQFGKLLLDAGNTAEAITHLELAEQADGSLDFVHYQLQAAYRKSGRIADADREARLYREIKARRRDLPIAR